MRVTYIGATGTIRMVYLNVARYDIKTNGAVELWFRCCDKYSTLALINLAPGEYLEWSKDAERS